MLLESGQPLLSATGILDTVQGDLDVSLLLFDAEDGLRLDLRRDEIKTIQLGGPGSFICDLNNGLRVALALTPVH